MLWSSWITFTTVEAEDLLTRNHPQCKIHKSEGFLTSMIIKTMIKIPFTVVVLKKELIN